MNFLDLATYLPKLGRLTASLNNSYTGSSHVWSDSLASGTNRVRKKNKKIKKETIVLMKKQVPSQSSAYKNPSWMSQQLPASPTKKPKGSTALPKSKNFTVKKKIKIPKTARPTNTELLLKQAKQIAGDTEDLHILQEAIIEFKTQRDQFVQSLNSLQKKLKEFQIPDLFAPLEAKPDEDGKETPSSNEKLKTRQKKEKNEKAGGKGGRKKGEKKKKDVRSVSQHFYLADMTESGDDTLTTSSSSSSTESSSSQDKGEAGEQTLANKKVKDSLDFNLIPIQPPENGRGLDLVNSLMKHSSPWAHKTSKSVIDSKLGIC